MKKFLMIAAILAIAPVCSKSGSKSVPVSDLFQSVGPDQAVLVQKGPEKKWCPNCGMNLVMFYKTTCHIVLEDDTKVQFCSLHCLADTCKDGKYNGKKIKEIYGVDIKSLKQFPVKELTYVVGSKVKGTMTKRSKYAFKSKDDAKKFMSEKGGKLATFDEALAMAREDLAADKKMVGMKRSKMMYPAGKKILNNKCDKKAVESIQYDFINDLKVEIMKKSLCGELKPKELQALALYVDNQKKK
jgi:nitrous oxide reductase accessory protein NosL